MKNLPTQSQILNRLIDRIEHFLLELGKGFLFEARQKCFTFNEDHFFVEMVDECMSHYDLNGWTDSTWADVPWATSESE